MTFYILSQREAVQTAYKFRNNTMAIISITEPDAEDVDFSTALVPDKRILRLRFDDIDKEINNHKLFTVQDAKQILNFVQKTIASVDFFVVHCHAGISRSAGVAAALSKIYNQNDSYIFNCGKYCPNMFVYKTILTEYFSNRKKYL